MLLKSITFLFLLFFARLEVYPQACTTLGQNPSTAFPVCGTATFAQSIVPYCGGTKLTGPCSSDDISDTNPFWYKFTCYSAGTLGFLITPNDLNDDYDWEIFDITGHDPNAIYTNTSLFVACNWSGITGLTGASSSGNSLQNCAGNRYPAFSAMPTLTVGHEYLLLLSHFTTYTPSQNGYQLSFGGGTASITDTLLPALSGVRSSCDASQIIVKLNKKIKCTSLAANGSDFIFSPAISGITGATGLGCDNNFDMDSVRLTLTNPLPPGDYTITIKSGTDNNTLVDNCDRGIAPGSSLPLVILPLRPTPMDSLTIVGCAPQLLQLVFKNKIRCNSITNGSEFVITGAAPVSITSVQVTCINEATSIINVILAGPIVTAGNYQIKLITGTDGNTLLDDCGQETPAGSALNFSIKDTVSAAFTYTLNAGCEKDTINFSHDGSNGVNQWRWRLDEQGTSNLQNPVVRFSTFGPKQISLAVSNGLCTDTATQIIVPGNELKADFETANLLCPEDPAIFVNKSIGDITSYSWNFGNGNTSGLQTPGPLYYPVLSLEKTYQVSLIVQNGDGCFDTASHAVKVLKSCYIDVPNAFTPNGDGLNDFLYPVNAYKADSLEFSIYNRLGQLVFYTRDWTKKWDGKIKQYPQDSGIFAWILRYTHHDTGKRVFKKGTSVLLR